MKASERGKGKVKIAVEGNGRLLEGNLEDLSKLFFPTMSVRQATCHQKTYLH